MPVFGGDLAPTTGEMGNGGFMPVVPKGAPTDPYELCCFRRQQMEAMPADFNRRDHLAIGARLAPLLPICDLTPETDFLRGT